MDSPSVQLDGPDDSPRALPLRRPPLLSLDFVTLAAVGAILSFHFFTSVLPGALEEAAAPEGRLMLGVAVLMLVPVALALRRLWVRRRPLPPIRLFREFMELPVSVYASAARRVPYGEILSFYVGGPPQALRVLLESRRHIFHFQQSAFVDPDGPEQLVAEMRRRILALGEGERILASMAERQSLAGRALSKRPFFTQLLLGMLVVFSINQYLLGGFGTPFGTLRWGAVSGLLVRQGELFRLLAASFLHAHWVHLGVNAVALLSLGGVMERLLGPYRFLLVYLLAGLGGTIASAGMGGLMSVGASGAIFGLLGGLAVVNWRYRTQLPLGIRQPLRWWIFILSINGLLPILLPIIDFWAHAGGFLAGGLVTWLLLDRRPEVRLAPPAGPALRVATLAVAAMYAVGLGTAVWYAATSDIDKEVAFARRVATDPATDERMLNQVAAYAPLMLEPGDLPLLERIVASEAVHHGALNNLAFILAIEKELLPEHLPLAESAARRAVREQPIGGYEDTLATVLYRRGRLDEAIDVERRVLEASQEGSLDFMEAMADGGPPFYASQLQRFLWRRFESAGPVAAADVQQNAVNARVAAEREQPAVVVDLNEPFARGLTLYAVVMRGEEPAGLFQLLLGPRPTRRYAFEAPPGMSLAGARLELAFVSAESSLPPEQTRWEIWSMHPEVARYP